MLWLKNHWLLQKCVELLRRLIFIFFLFLFLHTQKLKHSKTLDSVSNDSLGNSPKPGGDREVKSLKRNQRSGQRAAGRPGNQTSRTVKTEAGGESLACRPGTIIVWCWSSLSTGLDCLTSNRCVSLLEWRQGEQCWEAESRRGKQGEQNRHGPSGSVSNQGYSTSITLSAIKPGQRLKVWKWAAWKLTGEKPAAVKLYNGRSFLWC